MRAGRKRVTSVLRYPGGQVVHVERRRIETADAIKATVLAHRRRHHPDVRKKDLERALTGYELGRLFLRGGIGERQRRAGETWASLVCQFARAMGYPALTPGSVRLAEGKGLSCEPEADPERVARLRRDYADACRCLADAGRTLRETRLIQAACKEVCLLDTDTRSWPPHMLDALGRGLNELAALFRL
jgi:hypothetical protein